MIENSFPDLPTSKVINERNGEAERTDNSESDSEDDGYNFYGTGESSTDESGNSTYDSETESISDSNSQLSTAPDIDLDLSTQIPERDEPILPTHSYNLCLRAHLSLPLEMSTDDEPTMRRALSSQDACGIRIGLFHIFPVSAA